MARARMGDGNAAVHLLKLMKPVESTRIPDAIARYRGEPYVVAADVYSAEGQTGRSGWTWYTGSAGWMYRIWIEEVLGFRLRGDELTLKPVIPDDWPGFEITYRYHSAMYEIAVGRQDARGATTVELDGQLMNDGVVHLANDGATHHVTVRIAKQLPKQPQEATSLTHSSHGTSPVHANGALTTRGQEEHPSRETTPERR
jgi:cyclic beta-1,2-glucan synthetase